ncbi:MAG: hypothetical protein D6691_08410 [Candidatus Hydrogenedentota bacterium]|nr:MAG: hypothetical protein D6691_08410 [Candidatus Hydrogenedentota bacterium]GIX45151.1 MAG: hypothetical protein KatS3mg130_1559 [Candidatus Sumerlaea sp.]
MDVQRTNLWQSGIVRRFLTNPSLALWGLAMFVYVPALMGGTIWDDQAALRNPLLTSFAGLGRIWFRPGSDPLEEHYWPVTYTVFWLLHRLGAGGSPWVFHLLNVVLHATNAVLVYRLARRLQISYAWIGAAIFAVHPLHVESVAWIVELKNVLSFTFGALALGRWLRRVEQDPPTRALPWDVLGLYVLAMWSKSAVAPLPLVAGLLTWWRFPNRLRREIPSLALWLSLSVALVVLDLWIVQGSGRPTEDLSVVERIALIGQTVWFYVLKLLWPDALCAIYPKWQPLRMGLLLSLLPTLSLFLLVIATAVVCVHSIIRPRMAPNSVPAGFFAVSTAFVLLLLPVTGVVPFSYQRQSFVADRFVYHASVFMICALTELTANALRWVPQGKRVGVFLTTAVMCVLGVLTFVRANTFADIERLAQDTLAKNPEATVARYYLADALAKRGDYPRVLQEYANTFWTSLKALEPRKDALLQEARLQLEKTPNHPSALFNLGLALAAGGELKSAEEVFARVCELDSSASQAKIARAVLLEQLGQTTAALRLIMELYRADKYTE